MMSSFISLPFFLSHEGERRENLLDKSFLASITGCLPSCFPLMQRSMSMDFLSAIRSNYFLHQFAFIPSIGLLEHILFHRINKTTITKTNYRINKYSFRKKDLY